MAGPTAEQNKFAHAITGVNPDAYTPAPTNGAPPDGLPADAPTAAPLAAAPPPAAPSGMPGRLPPNFPMPDPNFFAAMEEARQWVLKYLAGNDVAAVPGADTSGPKAQVMFGGKAVPLDTAISTTVAAGALARLDFGDVARRQINADMARTAIMSIIVPPPPADDGTDKGNDKKKDDDGIDTTVEGTKDGVQTNIQITIKLRAEGEDDKRTVILLPDIEVTLHVGKDASTSTVEAQLNLVKIKKDVSDRLRFNAHVLVQSIEFKVGVSGEAGMTDVALLQIEKSLQVKVKAELEFKVNKAFSFSIEGDDGQGGFVIGPKLIYHF